MKGQRDALFPAWQCNRDRSRCHRDDAQLTSENTAFEPEVTAPAGTLPNNISTDKCLSMEINIVLHNAQAISMAF